MCYLIVKHVDKEGCIALRTSHGKHLVELKRRIAAKVGYEKIQLITISRPSAYAEYVPYHIVNTEEELLALVDRMRWLTLNGCAAGGE